MREDREWVNTALLHGLGRAHGVNVLVLQEHAEEALVGEGMMENVGDGANPPIMVLIALVSIHHFWGPWNT